MLLEAIQGVDQATRERLSDEMLRGLQTPGVKESRGHTVHINEDGYVHVCALGLAWVGRVGTKKAGSVYKGDWRLTYDHVQSFSRLLEIPEPLAKSIDEAHFEGMPAREIADLLRNPASGGTQ